MASFLFASEFVHKKGHYEIKFENLAISPTENMGLFGASYFVDFEDYYIGPTVYGALTGKRGGFFVGGFELGKILDISEKSNINTSFYIGGGGGGSAPQGGGLMLRTQASLNYDFSFLKVGVGVSYVSFPNGDIDSSQVFLKAQIPFDLMYLDGHKYKLYTTYGAIRDQLGNDFYASYMTATSEQYSPLKKSLYIGTNKKIDNFRLLGFEYGKFLNDDAFVFVQTAGALGGAAGGYAELFSGIGYKYEISNLPLSLDARLQAGLAGGGRVDTGGGFVLKGRTGLYYDLTKNVSLRGSLGYLFAPDGSFEANSYGLDLVYNYDVPSRNTLKNNPETIDMHTTPWSLSVSHKSYLKSATMLSDKKRKTQRIDLVGMKIKQYIHPNFYLTGQGYGAYRGDVGGYAEGLFGVGWKSATFLSKLQLSSELLFGAGAGGGVDSGGGAIAAASVALSYELSKSLDLTVHAGKMQALSAGINVNSIGLELTHKFSTLDF